MTNPKLSRVRVAPWYLLRQGAMVFNLEAPLLRSSPMRIEIFSLRDPTDHAIVATSAGVCYPDQRIDESRLVPT